jgi:hypothetical protein
MTAAETPLTADAIRRLPAGLEMDALVATRVLKLPAVELKGARCPECGAEMRFCGQRSYCSDCGEWRHSPYREYSDEIDAAWNVVERLAERNIRLHLEDARGETGVSGWVAWFDLPGGHTSASEWALSAPEAICRAALILEAA